MQLGRTRVVIARLYFSGTDSVGAPAPSCWGGQGWGVARAEEISECTAALFSCRSARPPSSVLPHKGARRDDPRVNLKAEGSNTREMAKTWRKHSGSGWF